MNLQGAGPFQAAGTTSRLCEASTARVTDGVFRVSHNPMYLGSMLSDVAVLRGALTTFFAIPIFVLLIQQHFILAEEQMLAKRSGVTYDGDRRRVRRWLKKHLSVNK